MVRSRAVTSSDLESELRRARDELGALNDIARTLTSSLEIAEVMTNIFAKVSALLQPSNWSLLLYDEQAGDLYFAHTAGRGSDALKGMRLGPEEGLAGWVFTQMRPLAVGDVRNDARFARRFDRANGFETRSVVAAPLVVKDHCLGVVELVNGPGDRAFDERDAKTLLTVADFAAIALDNARNYAKVQDLTIVDEHTGLYNSRHLHAVLRSEVQRAVRFGHPVSVIFIDLDHFKDINDAHGHQVGSATLREFGQLLHASCRAVDVPTRYGGDEFAIVLPETAKDQALLMGERLRRQVKARRFMELNGLNLALTASFGIACFPDDAQDPEALLRVADQAMYRVKQGSRDGVLAAPTPGKV